MIIATISTQRSGTKLLGSCFQSGTAVTPFGEVFNPDVRQIGSFSEYMLARGWQETHLGNQVLLDKYFGQFAHVCSVASIDIMFNQIEIPCVSWNDAGTNYALYAYLRQSGAIVISLERDPFDTFVSMKHLALAGGRAHPGDGEQMRRLDETARLDEAELRRYCDYVERHRAALTSDMSDYDGFFRLAFDELAKVGLPSRLIEQIAATAHRRGVGIKPERVQIHLPAMQAGGLDYGQVFENYEILRSKYGVGRTVGFSMRKYG